VTHHFARCEFLVGHIPERGFAGEEELQAVLCKPSKPGQLPVGGGLECLCILGCLHADECSLRITPFDGRTRCKSSDARAVLVPDDCTSERQKRREVLTNAYSGPEGIASRDA